MDISEIRLKNARYLAESVGGVSAFAEKVGKGQPQMSSVIGAKPIKNIGSRLARDLEAQFKKPKGWLDNVHDGITTTITTINEMGTSPKYDLSDDSIEIARLLQTLPKDQQAIVLSTITTLIDLNNKTGRRKKNSAVSVDRRKS